MPTFIFVKFGFLREKRTKSPFEKKESFNFFSKYFKKVLSGIVVILNIIYYMLWNF